ncbi:PAS domain-containing protein [Desulforamulus ferrireducens]|uniref:histidine kinase n=1 Tax=Desulforamulus ferrireducens TaxID=1833852 RepID=A0A1S6IWU7_9FIRM|nr:PAS domain-containing protein [Desulforamulus ferrireducens]AQS59241.1 histidine kinase [Desulforamulus ferrireducens]
MSINKKYLTIAIILVFLSLASCLFLFKNINQAHLQISTLQQDQGRIAQLQQFTYNLDLLGVSVGDYILFQNESDLDFYYKSGSDLLKDEVSLYEPENPERNKKVLDLIETYHAYLSFIESRVLQEDIVNREALFQDNEEFANSLRIKANVVLNSYQQEVTSYSEAINHNSSQIRYLVLFILISSLLLLPFLLYLIFKPIIKKGLYLDYCFSNTDTCLLFINSEGVVKDINKAAQDLFEMLPEALLEKNINKFPEEMPQLQRITQPLLHTLMYQEEQLKVRVTFYKDGRPIELSVDYIPVFLMNRLVGALMMARTATNQKDKPLLLDTLEKERKRISIEIHDWIARYMSTIIHSLDFSLKLHQKGELMGQELMQRLSDLRNHCQNAAIEMRGIMNDIHPYLIDKVGLISALESYIPIFEKLNKIRVFIFYQDRALRIKKKDEIIIYRIIQEALSNVVKHANATEVDINFTIENKSLTIEVMDNGDKQEDFVAGKGLWGMKERASLIGAEIHFGYCETGFCVTLKVPILPGGETDGENQNYVD